jgi:transposase-like protein
MARRYRSYSLEFKRTIVQQYLEGAASAHGLARQHRLSAALIHYWAKQFAAGELEGSVGEDLERRELLARVALLERKVGQLLMQNELLKKTLPRSRSANGASCSIVSGPARSVSEKDVE